jgi:hypothetical protein
VGFAGKMQSGKDSSCNMLYALALRNVLGMTPFAEINEDGKVVAEDADGNRSVLNVDSRNPEFMMYMGEFVWPFIRKFSYAEPLKEFCQNILGLSEESVWGTNEQKNQPTHLKWEDMPTYSLIKKADRKEGLMTGREVMEYFGTQIARKMYPNVWADALIRKIDALGPKYATICDIRFPNEVEAVKNAGGKVIRLTLTTEEAKVNNHISNTALDDYTDFDAVIDNQNMTMQKAHAAILDKLIEWEFLSLVELEEK